MYRSSNTYYEALHEHMNLPDPIPHGYGATRSPDEYPQYAAARNLSSTSSEAQHFPPQHLEHAVHLSGYPPQDGPLNGNTPWSSNGELQRTELHRYTRTRPRV